MENPQQTSPNQPPAADEGKSLSLKGGEPKKGPDKWTMINLASEMGFIIALPIVVFALAGKWLDHKIHNTAPWFTLLGIVLAITSTTVWLTKKLKEYMK